MVSPNYGQESRGFSPQERGEGVAASPVEKLPQDLVHWLTVLLGGRIARHRRGRGLSRGGLGRRLCRRGRARDAALAARSAAALALTLAEATQALLQEIADCLAELAAERTARLGSSLSAGTALLFPVGVDVVLVYAPDRLA